MQPASGHEEGAFKRGPRQVRSDDDDCNRFCRVGLRGELLARRGDVRAIPIRSRVGQRDLAGVLLRLQAAIPLRRQLPPQPSRPASRPPAATPAQPDRHGVACRSGRKSAIRSAAPVPRSPPTWSAACRCRPRPASATSRPSCSRSTARSSTATAAAAARARSASPTSSVTPSCAPSPTPSPT